MPIDADWRTRLEAYVHAQGERGVRVLAVATGTRANRARWSAADESELVFAGFLCFADPRVPMQLPSCNRSGPLACG